MRAKFITFALTSMLFALCALVEAQQPTGKIPIGFSLRTWRALRLGGSQVP
jgi:hypothetical protein